MFWMLPLSDICDRDIIAGYIFNLLHEDPIHIFNFLMKLMKLVSFNYSENLYLTLRRIVQTNSSIVVVWVPHKEQLAE